MVVLGCGFRRSFSECYKRALSPANVDEKRSYIMNRWRGKQQFLILLRLLSSLFSLSLSLSSCFSDFRNRDDKALVLSLSAIWGNFKILSDRWRDGSRPIFKKMYILFWFWFLNLQKYMQSNWILPMAEGEIVNSSHRESSIGRSWRVYCSVNAEKET